MASIILEDDCLKPNREIVIRFKGPNPIRAYQVIKAKMREIWEVDAVAYWEREFRWDNSSNPHEFLVKSYVDKALDRFSRVLAEVFVQGYQPDDPNAEGTVEIRISGVLRTVFGGKSFFEDARNPIYRSLMWIYATLFYNKQRQFYLTEFCYNRANKFKRFYQEMLNILPAEPQAV